MNSSNGDIAKKDNFLIKKSACNFKEIICQLPEKSFGKIVYNLDACGCTGNDFCHL